MFHALRALPVRVASASQYLQPLIGVAASSAWFGDPLGAWFVGGMALVLGGIALTAYGGRRRARRRISNHVPVEDARRQPAGKAVRYPNHLAELSISYVPYSPVTGARGVAI